MNTAIRRPQVCVLGSAEPGSTAYELAGAAGELLARLGITLISGCGMGDARNLIMALAGDACLVIGGRAGTISEVCLAWLHKRPLLPLVGCGGWSDQLPSSPPDERQNAPILPWRSVKELQDQLATLVLIPSGAGS